MTSDSEVLQTSTEKTTDELRLKCVVIDNKISLICSNAELTNGTKIPVNSLFVAQLTQIAYKNESGNETNKALYRLADVSSPTKENSLFVINRTELVEITVPLKGIVRVKSDLPLVLQPLWSKKKKTQEEEIALPEVSEDKKKSGTNWRLWIVP